MKKILLLSLCTILLCGCNYQMVDLDYNYKKVHLYGTNKCYEINSWKDYEDGEQIQVDIKGSGKILLSSYSCFLVQDNCPICD